MKLLFVGIMLVAASCAANPVIQLNRTIYNGGDYELKCEYADTTNETTFSWQKDGVDTNETSDTFQIQDACGEKHNGNYTCMVTNGEANSTSDTYHLVVIFVPGKRCQTNEDCDGIGYKKQCNTTEPPRCLCADGYRPHLDQCQGISGASTVIGSLALLFVALVSSRIVN
ncbi:unnamed protein product [Lymnaea stagnalis]|uniref:Ig-like domain-containing protein n=1 Tax=Lymnaea stagnalis TaxID=6523 RepID=A0AAV2GZP3_LYMST